MRRYIPSGSVDRRRAILVLGGGLALVALRPVAAAERDWPSYQEALREIAGERAVNPGRISLELPKIAETGNSVPITVRVESPMTPENHVARIHVLSKGNPRPNVASFHLGPRAGLAEVGTRIKLSRTQQVVGLAEMSDGSLWQTEASIVVTQGACVEDIWTD
jgi:sulfur-oxidizing protein SoxY